MGIRGLMSFIDDYEDRCYESYKLRDTYLVIDGSNVSYQIFYRCPDLNCIFGGEYNVYEQAVSKFFDNLLECDVKPLVLLDGPYDISKTDTALDRHKQRLEQSSALIKNPTEGGVPYLLMAVVFVQVLRKKNIPHARCMYEADGAIAALAKVLKCPVLSVDSDFCIHGILYIPFNKLINRVKNTTSGKAMCCKIYKFENFLRIFGLTHHSLSLAAAILGTDIIIKPEILENFFSKFEVSGRWRYNKQIKQQTFTWLGRCILDEAIAEILSTIPPPMRQQMLDAIESYINYYTSINLPEAVLAPLNITEYKNITHNFRAYRFNRGIESLPFRGKWNYMETINDMVVIRNTLIQHTKDQNENESIIDRLPRWFVDEVAEAKLPSALINYIVKHTSILPMQIDNLACRSSSLISLKIVSVTYGLLSSLIKDKKTCMMYVFRDKDFKFKCDTLEGTETKSLLTLRDIPLSARKEILDDALGIKNMKCVNELLPEWKLYIGCIKFWADQETLYKSHKYYAYSIIICILYNIIMSKVNQKNSINSLQEFNTCYGSLIEFSKKRRQVSTNKLELSTNVSMLKARVEIDMLDCLLWAPFCFKYSKMQSEEIITEKVDMSIVHAFAQFQMCLLSATDLNALLGFPYKESIVTNLFNGTFLYNICKDLQTSDDIDERVNDILKDSPTILRLFNALLSKINPLLA